jgi:hypothetical protein
LTEYKHYANAVKIEEKLKHTRNVTDFSTVDGKADVRLNQNSSVFCNKMGFYIDSH